MLEEFLMVDQHGIRGYFEGINLKRKLTMGTADIVVFSYVMYPH
jgi:hypothetical protein